MAPPRSGLFVTLEGVDGSGKSTMAASLAEALGGDGWPVTVTREPGGSPVAERVREVLLDPAATGMAWATEVLLYLASRAEHVAATIRPALDRGEVVICDRFLDSTLAYQGWGRCVQDDPDQAVELIREANRLATRGLEPELTLLLDIDPAIGLERTRRQGRNPDRLEGEGLDFLRRVRHGFHVLAEREPERIYRVDASRDEDDILNELLAITRAHIGCRGLR